MTSPYLAPTSRACRRAATRAGDGSAGGTAATGQQTATKPPINDPRVISDATPDDDWKPGAQYAQVEMGRLVAEIPVGGDRRCVYNFGTISVVVPGPVNFRCPSTSTLAGTSHGYLLNDNGRR